ncbi:response regulator transcription factor [Curtanaerobium respiraculi]|uniref:response regulator transcription factor n=1 Tax=Curtanaerobium respiraculi TaxID=2949669 RepID=UPI0024B328A2|nr:response regulator transcription factor [Curtanaerobium respiraculi]
MSILKIEHQRILLADDHPLLTEGLKMIIDEWEEFSVVGIAADGQEAVAMCDELAPDIVVMDMQMPKLSGPDAIRQIRVAHPDVKVLALTTFDDDETVAQAMEAGCDGFLLKVIERERLRDTLISITRGMNVYDQNAVRSYSSKLKQKREAQFSERERQIMALLCEGFTNAEIAGRIHLKTGTVKNLVSLLLSKTGCVSRAQLVRYATENHLVE